VFLVNSRLGLLPATPARFHRQGVHASGVPLLPKLRGHFAEFLNEGSPVHLGLLDLSTCVGLRYGQDAAPGPAFLGSAGSTHLGSCPDHHASPCGYTLGRLTPLGLPPCVPGPFDTTPWYRNLDRLSIAYGCRPRLRPDSPAADDHRCGTLRHSVGRFRTVLALLIPAFALVAPPGLAPAAPSPATTTLPYHWFAPVHGLGGGLSPGTLSAPGHHRPVSYYALFQGWLLLSQPPGCLCARTSLSTQSTLGDLSRWSGLLPSRRRIFAPAVSLRWLARRHSEFGARW
jgi:hypothetical protein